MSALRKPFRVTVDGVPHDIVTSARDFAAIQLEDGQTLPGVMSTWAMLHAAMLRLGVPGIPSDLNAFVDLLDEIEDLDGIPVGVNGSEVATDMYPTQTALLVTEPSG